MTSEQLIRRDGARLLSLPVAGAVRRLWPFEVALARDHLLRLEPESRRLRFNGVVSDDAIEEHVGRLAGKGAVVVGYIVDGVARGLGELLPFGSGSSHGEAAFSVEPGFRGRGVGGALARRIVNAAQNRLLDRLYMTCARDNSGMIAVARGLTGRLLFEEGEARAVLAVPPPTTLSLMLEAVDGASGGAALWQRALSRRPWAEVAAAA